MDFQFEPWEREVGDHKTQAIVRAIIRGRQHRDALATLADEYARLFGYEPGQCQYETLCRVILDGEDPSEALAAARKIDKAIEEMTDMSGDEMTPGPFG